MNLATWLTDGRAPGTQDRPDETKPKTRSNRRLFFAVVARDRFREPDADDRPFVLHQFRSAQNGKLLARPYLRSVGHRADIPQRSLQHPGTGAHLCVYGTAWPPEDFSGLRGYSTVASTPTVDPR